MHSYPALQVQKKSSSGIPAGPLMLLGLILWVFHLWEMSSSSRWTMCIKQKRKQSLQSEGYILWLPIQYIIICYLHMNRFVIKLLILHGLESISITESTLYTAAQVTLSYLKKLYPPWRVPFLQLRPPSLYPLGSTRYIMFIHHWYCQNYDYIMYLIGNRLSVSETVASRETITIVPMKVRL